MNNWAKFHEGVGYAVPDLDMARFMGKVWIANDFDGSKLKVLDVGCGDGINGYYLNQRYGMNVLGIDTVNAFQAGNCLMLNFYDMQNESFNCIVDVECLVYLGKKGLEKAYSVLNKGGILFSKMFMEKTKGMNYTEKLFLYNPKLIDKIFGSHTLHYTITKKSEHIYVKEAIWSTKKR